jgi:hypothetical protein
MAEFPEERNSGKSGHYRGDSRLAPFSHPETAFSAAQAVPGSVPLRVATIK